MLKHVFLFDVTRHNGLVQSLIGSAQTYTSQFQPDTIEWFARPQQSSALRDAGMQVHVISAAAVWPTIEHRVRELTADGCQGSLFHILSYDPVVIQSAAAMNSPEVAVSALSLATLSRKPGTTERRPIPAAGRPTNFVSSFTLSDAIGVTKKMLEKRHAVSPNSAIKQSFLRRLLIAEDPRFLFNSADPNSRTIITDVVGDGLRNGWLERFRLEDKTGTERLYLTTGTAISAAAPIHSIAPAPHTPKAVDSTSTNPLPTMPALLTDAEDKGRERTAQMIRSLKQRRIYSPKAIRDYIFKALRAATQQSSLMPQSASQLIRQVCSSAENQAKADGVDFKFWYAASDACFEMMLGAGILLDENKQPIRPGLRSRGTKVHDIVPEFEDRCELFLLEHLIRNLGNLSQRDRTALAHALFKVDPKQKSICDMQDRVDELLIKLQDSVSENDDGIFVIEKLKLAAVG